MAIRFKPPRLGGDPDIVAHSANAFPARNAEEFLEFLQAVLASGPNAAKPTPIEKFLGSHPNSLRFVQIPKPTPGELRHESLLRHQCLSIREQGRAEAVRPKSHHPVAGVKATWSKADAKGRPANFLFDELGERLGKGPVSFRLFLQLPAAGT